MFYQSFSALMSHIRIENLPTPQPTSARASRVEADALRALKCDPGAMRLSQRLRDPDGWRQLQRERRNALESLLFAEPTEEALACALDLIAAIAEESTWSDNAACAPFDDDAHPEIDLASAETAVLLGWTKRLWGKELDELSPRIASRMLAEARRRLFTPLMAHDDYPFMTGQGRCPMAVCADLLLAALLLETDDARLHRMVKPLLRLLDENCGRHGRAPAPLAERITDIAVISDLAVLLRSLTRGAFDLSAQIPFGEWLDEILFAWIQGPWFVDPAGDGLTPPLSGGDVFRVGLAADDGALTALGAQICRQNHLPSATVTGRLMELSAGAAMESENSRPPRMRYAATHRNQLMTARMDGLYCALHTGGNRANAGDVCLFADGSPILVDVGRDFAARNLPTLAGRAQLQRPDVPCAADFEAREDRETLSVELTHAYPAECRLRSYQRSLLTLRSEQVLRMVDMLSFDAPTALSFSFVTPVQPVLHRDEILLGPVRMTWEGDLSLSAGALGDQLFQIELTSPQPVAQALYAFNFEHL